MQNGQRIEYSKCAPECLPAAHLVSRSSYNLCKLKELNSVADPVYFPDLDIGSLIPDPAKERRGKIKNLFS
jgi:hypothetical protein